MLFLTPILIHDFNILSNFIKNFISAPMINCGNIYTNWISRQCVCNGIYSDLIHYNQSNTSCTTMFNIHKSFFLPQSLCLWCFVWFSQQISIIFLYDINWPDFITKLKCFILRGTKCILPFDEKFVHLNFSALLMQNVNTCTMNYAVFCGEKRDCATRIKNLDKYVCWLNEHICGCWRVGVRPSYV